MYLHLVDSEHATILAALRFWQEAGMGEPTNRSEEFHEIATNRGEVISLDSDGIDYLCERLNTEPSLNTLEPGRLNSVRTAVVSILHLTLADRRRLQDGTFTVCAASPDPADSCFIVSAHAAADCPSDLFPGASEEFLAICRLAVDDGCALVRFDDAGDIYPAMAVFAPTVRE